MPAQIPPMDGLPTTAPRSVVLSPPSPEGLARASALADHAPFPDHAGFADHSACCLAEHGDASEPSSLSVDDPACALQDDAPSTTNARRDATAFEAPRPLLSLVSRHFDQTVVAPMGSDAAPLLRDEPSSLSGFDPVGLRDGQTVVLGRYEVLGEIARGGMGVVYRARQIGLNRVVALKMVLAGRFADAEDVQRLHQEAEVTAKLRHPNIVRVYEFTESEGRHFIAMDYVPGRSLAQEARQFTMSARRAADILRQLAEAVHYAHDQGVLHRDLKPSNILLDASGRPQITDFGVAKELFGNSRGTTIGRVVGTPAYMAPEQAGGQKHLMGPASDVYSLGAILYELLTGRPPFQASNPLDVFTQIKTAEPLPPQLFNPKTPADLQTICLKCLAKEPRRRYATAKELAEDLERFLAGEPILARPVRLWERAIEWAKRRPGAAAIAGMAISALACVQLSILWYHAQLNDSHERLAGALELAQKQSRLAEAERKKADWQRRVASDQHRLAEQQAELARQRELTARRHLYAVHLDLVQEAWERSHVGRVLELLEEQRPQPGQTDVRGFEWHYFWRQAHTDVATLTGHAKAVTSVTATADGSRVVTSGFDGIVRVWNAATRRVERVFHGPESGLLCAALAADGKLVFAGGYDGIVRGWSLESGDLEFELATATGPIRALAISRSGRTLAAAGEDGVLRIWDVAARELQGEGCGHHGAIAAAAFSPSGELIATGGADGVVKLWKAADGSCVADFYGHEDAVSSLCFSNAGAALVSGSADGDVRVWDLTRAKTTVILKVMHGPVTSVALSPDSRSLAVGTAERSIVVVRTADWSKTAVLRGHVEPVSSVAFLGRGERLVSGSWDGAAKIWDPARRPQERVLTEHAAGEATCVAFSPQGTLFATGGGPPLGSGGPGEVYLRDAATGRAIRALSIPEGRPTQLAFSPDGATLAVASRGATAEEGGVHLFHVASGRRLASPPDATGAFNCLTYSRQGRRLAAAGDSGELRLWTRDAGATQTRLAGHTAPAVGLSFSPDGETLASASLDGTVRLWDATTGVERHVFYGHQTYSPVAFSPDGRFLATSSQDPHQECCAIEKPRPHPGDPASLSTVGDVTIYDAKSLTPLFTLKGHAKTVQQVVFSPDGDRLATAGRDGTLRLWDSTTGHQLVVLHGHEGPLYDAAFSPDGRSLASCSADGTVRLWQTQDDEPAGEQLARQGE